MDVYNLKQSCEQAEVALSQGIEKLQQTLADTIATDHLGDGLYTSEMANNAIEKLEALVSFANQVITPFIHHFIHILAIISLIPFIKLEVLYPCEVIYFQELLCLLFTLITLLTFSTRQIILEGRHCGKCTGS